MPKTPLPLIPLPPQGDRPKATPIPSSGVTRGPPPTPLWVWGIFVGLVLVVSAAIGVAVDHDAATYERRCQSIAVMGPCADDGWGISRCRVETVSGVRVTVGAPKMVGDVACWNEPVGE